jgi:glutathione S-transferase
MITVYGRATSSNVQAVMWGVGELGLAHERLDYGHTFGGTNTPEFRAMNPNGLVPVLRDGDLVMWESAAILRYLASRYGAGPFWPADPVDRAPVDMWAEWGKVTLAPAFTMPIFWSRVRTAAKDRDEAALTAAITRFDGLLGILEPRLAPFVMGSALTLADIVIGHVLYRYYTMDIPRPDRPGIAAYYQRLAERPAYRAHVMVSWKSLEAEGA